MQTALEWFFNELQRMQYFIGNDMLQALEQAKQMEKEQIMEAVSFGDCRGRVTTYLTEDEYYNETYGSKGSDETLKDYHIVDTNKMVEDTFKVWECCGMEECICKTEISKEEQKEKLVQLMEADAKDGLYNIELSDEEIEKGAENAWSDYEYEDGNLYSTTFKGGWKLAIKCYREQLKQRQ